jgi:hypothetical protein
MELRTVLSRFDKILPVRQVAATKRFQISDCLSDISILHELTGSIVAGVYT